MSNEAAIRTSLRIVVGGLTYQSQPTAFTTDVSVAKGPTPGLVVVPTTGTEIDLSLLSTPGLARIMNTDETNYVEVGIYDQITHRFYPLLEFPPGHSYPMCLSRNLLEDYVGTGTGTSARINKLWALAHGGPCNLLVEAFEK